MPHTLSQNSKQVLFEYFGLVTTDDILTSNSDVYGDPRFDELRWQIVLFDRVSRVNYFKKDVKKIAFLDMAAFE